MEEASKNQDQGVSIKGIKEAKRPNVEFIHSELREKLNFVRESITSIETKSSVFSGFIVAIIVLILDKNSSNMDEVLYLLAFLLNIISFVFFAIVLFITSHNDPHTPEILLSKESINRDYFDLVNESADKVKKAYDSTIIIHRRKAKFFKLAFVLFSLGITMYIISTFIRLDIKLWLKI